MKQFCPDCCKGEFDPSIYGSFLDYVLFKLDCKGEDYLYKVSNPLNYYYSLAKDYNGLVEAVKDLNRSYGDFDYSMDIIPLKKNVPNVDWEDIYRKEIAPNYFGYNATIRAAQYWKEKRELEKKMK